MPGTQTLSVAELLYPILCYTFVSYLDDLIAGPLALPLEPQSGETGVQDADPALSASNPMIFILQTSYQFREVGLKVMSDVLGIPLMSPDSVDEGPSRSITRLAANPFSRIQPVRKFWFDNARLVFNTSNEDALDTAKASSPLLLSYVHLAICNMLARSVMSGDEYYDDLTLINGSMIQTAAALHSAPAHVTCYIERRLMDVVIRIAFATANGAVRSRCRDCLKALRKVASEQAMFERALKIPQVMATLPPNAVASLLEIHRHKMIDLAKMIDGSSEFKTHMEGFLELVRRGSPMLAKDRKKAAQDLKETLNIIAKVVAYDTGLRTAEAAEFKKRAELLHATVSSYDRPEVGLLEIET